MRVFDTSLKRHDNRDTNVNYNAARKFIFMRSKPRCSLPQSLNFRILFYLKYVLIFNHYKIRQANGLEACPSTYDLLLIFNLDKMSERQGTLIAKYLPRAPAEHPLRTPCAFLAERVDDDRPQ